VKLLFISSQLSNITSWNGVAEVVNLKD
jgi:hypothetical protein